MLILAGFLLTTQAFALDKKQTAAVNKFIDLVKQDDIKGLAKIIQYPLIRQYPLPPISNEKEFTEKYPILFDFTLRNKITSSKIGKHWVGMRWRGIMFNGGNVWLTHQGELTAINYSSEAEQFEWKKLVKEERQTLHTSLQEYVKPILKYKSEKFLVRIDDLGEGNFRYASWPAGKSLKDSPSLVLEKGQRVNDGSAGNHHYIFLNGNYKYQLYVNIVQENDSASGLLNVFKDGKEILSQSMIPTEI